MRQQNGLRFYIKVVALIFSPTTTTVESSVETTTDSLLITSTELTTTNSSIEDETQEERNSVPLWVTILICFSLLLCTLIAAALYLKQRKPEIWKSIKNKIPVVSRQNFYQVSPLSSCRRQYGINVITNCLPSKTLSSIFNIKSLRSSKEEPSRDTCFLCMRKVPTKNPNII